MKAVIDRENHAYVCVNRCRPVYFSAPAPGRIMKKMKDVPEHDRPREKIAKKGVAALTDTELIEAILGRGVENRDVRMIARDIAAMLAIRPGRSGMKMCWTIGGMGPTKAAQIMACLELGRRRYETGSCRKDPEAGGCPAARRHLPGKTAGIFYLHQPFRCRRGDQEPC